MGVFSRYSRMEFAEISSEPIVLRDLVHPKIKQAVRPHMEKAKTMARAGTLVAQKHLYSYILTAARKAAPAVEKVSHKVESRLMRVRNAIRGRGDLPTNRGSASLFLQHIASTQPPKPKGKKSFVS